MALFEETNGTWHGPSVTPLFKRPTDLAWVMPSKVYRKVGLVWQEVWPLLPDAVPIPTWSQAFVGDVINWTFSWTPPVANPVASAAVISYTVRVYVNGVLFYTNTLNALTMPLNDMRAQTGKSVYFTVTANSQYGPGPSTNSATQIGMTPPPPPAASGLSLVQSQVLVGVASSVTWTFSWTAGSPTGLAALTNYTVSVYLYGVLYNSYTIAAGTTSMVLTGMQSQAGKTVYFTVTANSQYGPGTAVQSDSQTAWQIPAPPAPTNFGFSIDSAGAFHESWVHGGGNRLSGFWLTLGGGNWANYDAATRSVAVGSSALGTYTVDLYAYGPGGNSPMAGAITRSVDLPPGYASATFSDGTVNIRWPSNSDIASGSVFFQRYYDLGQGKGYGYDYYGVIWSGGIAPGSSLSLSLPGPVSANSTGQVVISSYDAGGHSTTASYYVQ